MTRRQPKFRQNGGGDYSSTLPPTVPSVVEEDKNGVKRIHSTLDAASAAEMLQKLELDSIMLSEWYKLSDDQGRKNFEMNGQVENNEEDVRRSNYRLDDGQTMHAPRKSYQDDKDINVKVYSPSPSPPPFAEVSQDSYLVGIAYTEAHEKKRKEKEKWSQYPQYKKGAQTNVINDGTTNLATGFRPADKVLLK